MAKTPDSTTPQHFYSLDAVRGIASMIVVIYHWQFFYYKDDVFVLNHFDRYALPWYQHLSMIYEYAVVAVDLFFLLSGFIFFWLYAERIATHSMTFGRFAVLRISRLYPLHFACLIAVAVLQWMMLKVYGHYYILVYNDFYHFILNLLFMQTWGFEKGFSFNGPSWSVSVEVFLYLLFFVICWCRWQTNRGLLILLIPLGAIIQHYGSYLGKGIFSFFLGALVYYLYNWIVRENKGRKYLPYILALTGVLWAFVFVAYRFNLVYPLWEAMMKKYRPEMNVADYHANYHTTINLIFRVTVSPCTIICLVLWESAKGQWAKWLSVIGNSSYAIYLIHFPLQIVFVLVLKCLGLDRSLMYSPVMLMLFLAILVPISTAAFYYFELPMEKILRQALVGRKKTLVT